MAEMVATATKAFEAGAAISQFIRVKFTSSKLAVAGATDPDIGTVEEETFASGDIVAVRLKSAQGTCKMVASNAITAYANVYGAANGKVDDVANENFQGIALIAATADGDIVEVLRHTAGQDIAPHGSIDGPIIIDDDFVGDWPAAATALDGQSWTKVETNGLGVIGIDSDGGIIEFGADAVAEAATATLYYKNSPIDPSKGGVAEFIIAIFDIGDDVAVDFDFGLASDAHATDFESIPEFVAFHLNGNDLSLFLHSDDGTTDTAPVDTMVDLVDNTYYNFKIDYSDLTDIKFWYRALNPTNAWIALLDGTTFAVSAATANWTPIILVEKTSNNSTFALRADRIRVQAERAY